MGKNLTSAKGVRAIAVFELSKGLFSLAAGIVLILLLHKNLNTAATDFLNFLHIGVTGYFAKFVLENVSQINESNIKLFIVLAFVYTLVRFIEAYGLWRFRTWAEWFAIASGAIYLPIEIYEIIKNPTVFKFVIFFLNIVLVGYLIYVRREANYHRNQLPTETENL